ncbi:MAG TPA: hypothetical protein VLS45_00635 [Methylomicrobium sp.]|nr:hypothetical protein [Methylomicrobium sp.]
MPLIMTDDDFVAIIKSKKYSYDQLIDIVEEAFPGDLAMRDFADVLREFGYTKEPD